MNWLQAKELIKSKISVGTNVNSGKSTYRVIMSIPSSADNYFKIRYSEKGSPLQISWTMLETCFNLLNSATGYSRSDLYKMSDHNSELIHRIDNHGCYVHTIGQIFVKAGIAKQVNRNCYVINA